MFYYSLIIYSIIVLAMSLFHAYKLQGVTPTFGDIMSETYLRIPSPYLRKRKEGAIVVEDEEQRVRNITTISLQRSFGGLHLAFHRYAQQIKFNEFERNTGFGSLDKQLYDVSEASATKKSPRIIQLHNYNKRGPTHLKRFIDIYLTFFSDNTQLYGFLDSGDEALAPMEKRMDLNESQCVPIEDWQSGHHPLCNTLHELDFIHLRDFSGNNVELVGKQGTGEMHGELIS